MVGSGWQGTFQVEVACSSRGSIELDEASALEDAIADGRRQVLVVQDPSPLPERFVGGENHGAFPEVSVVDHMEQDVGGIGSVSQVAYFVDHEHVSRNAPMVT
jgi:hypothetical protein